MIVGKSNGFLTAMLVVLIGLLTFTSCQKEDLDQAIADAQTAMTENNNNFLNYKDQSGETSGQLGHKPGRNGGDCFEVVFPIDISLPDGSVQTANSEEELKDILETWKEENEITGDTEAFPELVFPIDIILEDGTEQTVNSEEELFEIFFQCFGSGHGGGNCHGDSYDDEDDEEEGEDGEDDEDEEGEDEEDDEEEGEDEDEDEDDGEGEFAELCFDFTYPVTIIFPDGSTATVNSDEEGEMAIDNYYDLNLDEEEDPTLDYPVDVTLENGSIQTLNSDEDFDILEEGCEDVAG